jgi:hypothetical protein
VLRIAIDRPLYELKHDGTSHFKWVMDCFALVETALQEQALERARQLAEAEAARREMELKEAARRETERRLAEAAAWDALILPQAIKPPCPAPTSRLDLFDGNAGAPGTAASLRGLHGQRFHRERHTWLRMAPVITGF